MDSKTKKYLKGVFTLVVQFTLFFLKKIIRPDLRSVHTVIFKTQSKDVDTN